MIAKLQYLWYKLVQFITRLLTLVWGVRVFGQVHIPKTGGALIASNHQSYFDPALVVVGSNRPLHFVARHNLFKLRLFLLGRLFGILIRSLYAFPLERRRFSSQGVREAIRQLRKGKLLLVFPEGTRTFNGQVGDLKSGIIALAQRARVPIVPVLVDGAFEAWPRHSRFPKRWYPIRVNYGTPVIIDPKSSPDQLSKLVRQKINELKRKSR